jgi:serine/threonine protein kinase
MPGETPFVIYVMIKLLTSEQSGQGLTNSTLQSYPAESPRNKRPIPSSPTSYASSNLDQAKVNELRQVLHVDQQMHGTEELLTDSLVITEESKVSENNRTVVKRVKVRGHWLAKKIYKHSDREQGEREIYLQEVEVLKLLLRKPHWHVILLLRHFEDPRGRGCLILSPLAQTTLEAFLSQSPSQERKTLVGPWIGCLASGLAHIHSQRVKHKDIKPSNILIHGTNPVIADMGISHRFENDSKSSGRSAGSFAYEAPEVIEEQVRGRRQDVWSLLCCYMEILAFLKDVDRRAFHKSVGGRIYFHRYDSVVAWLNSLKPHAVDEEELAFVQLLLDSFKRDPEERPYALDLAEQIQAICKQRPHKYIGECCVLDDIVNISSNLEHAIAGTVHTLPSPEDLEQGSLLHFVASMSLSLGESNILEAYPSLNTLYRQVSSGKISSIRSAERKFLLTIAPVRLLSHSRSESLLTHPIEILQRWQNLLVSQQWLY